MNKPDYLISTPENVDLHLELAGLGNRIWAALIDHAIIGAVLAIIVAACLAVGFSVDKMDLPSDTKNMTYFFLLGIAMLIMFVVNFGYFIIFEGVWQGQTPGKRVAGIRVIETNGQPIGWAAVFIRNLLRLIDGLPAMYPGILPMLIDKNERRLGDFAAGTLVIRERLTALGTSTLKIVNEEAGQPFFDVGQISPDEYNLIVNFLNRRELLQLAARQRLAADMGSHFKTKLNVMDDTDAPETFIEKLYVSYKSRAEIMD